METIISWFLKYLYFRATRSFLHLCSEEVDETEASRINPDTTTAVHLCLNCLNCVRTNRADVKIMRRHSVRRPKRTQVAS